MQECPQGHECMDSGGVIAIIFSQRWLAKLPDDANDPAPKRPVLELGACWTLIRLSVVGVGVPSVQVDSQHGAAALAGHGVNGFGVVRHVGQSGWWWH